MSKDKNKSHLTELNLNTIIEMTLTIQNQSNYYSRWDCRTRPKTRPNVEKFGTGTYFKARFRPAVSDSG